MLESREGKKRRTGEERKGFRGMLPRSRDEQEEERRINFKYNLKSTSTSAWRRIGVRAGQEGEERRGSGHELVAGGG